MLIHNCSVVATILFPWRWVLIALSLGAGFAIWFHMESSPEDWRAALKLGLPAISVCWAGAACAFNFHPERGTLSEAGWQTPFLAKLGGTSRTWDHAKREEFRKHAALTLHLYVLVGCLGFPLVLAHL
jgi:hypothetical protein